MPNPATPANAENASKTPRIWCIKPFTLSFLTCSLIFASLTVVCFLSIYSLLKKELRQTERSGTQSANQSNQRYNDLCVRFLFVLLCIFYIADSSIMVLITVFDISHALIINTHRVI